MARSSDIRTANDRWSQDGKSSRGRGYWQFEHFSTGQRITSGYVLYFQAVRSLPNGSWKLLP